MPPILTLVLVIVAAFLFLLGACSAPLGRFNPVAGGLFVLTLAVWLLPPVLTRAT